MADWPATNETLQWTGTASSSERRIVLGAANGFAARAVSASEARESQAGSDPVRP